MCGSMVDIQSGTAEIRRGKKIQRIKKKERRNHTAKILWPALLHRAAITNVRKYDGTLTVTDNNSTLQCKILQLTNECLKH